ncbi:4Fe-4S binding protein [Candidatus Arthromitus sp. SFB-rat-Yit]|uniref:4Fe-4S binding protein n=1 Tax=Candidatus Arthromitus sp. SFB-rat-Yit TaxID=1041504 RepID=UPI000227A086|nr:4Fe-4S binding protein [Candidatus Arthromitus sp. SFB-rat-Yit]BAK81811.1 4Fe-4S ferredoxin iron-sulfur binding domain protein [Candidatus Arthromitus sp. SFB-rat-Yit]
MAFNISDECIGCGACAADCPVMCISQKDDGRYKINPEECIDCGTCAGICPVSAISQE